MDANGLSEFSALPLFPLMAVFWALQRPSRREMGFAWGRRGHYGLAVLYPLVVMGALALIAALAHAIDLSQTTWHKAGLNLVLVSVTTFLVVTITEEGFFRGWLWMSLRRAEQAPGRTVIWTSLAFALWHVSAVTLKTGFEPPRAQVPVYLANAAVLGCIWGMMRWLSGSVIVTSLSHGLWNGLAYVLFGYGTKVGALGIHNTAVLGPEVGVVGLAVNLIFLAWLWRWLLGIGGPPRGGH
jgi:membrane protease YdiL (CAAX protease family)